MKRNNQTFQYSSEPKVSYNMKHLSLAFHITRKVNVKGCQVHRPLGSLNPPRTHLVLDK